MLATRNNAHARVLVIRILCRGELRNKRFQQVQHHVHQQDCVASTAFFVKAGCHGEQVHAQALLLVQPVVQLQQPHKGKQVTMAE